MVAACTGRDAGQVTGHGIGVDEATYRHKINVVRAALTRHAAVIARSAEPGAEWGVERGVELVAALGGLEHAALAGFILGGAARRIPVILDGVTAGAAALVAHAIAPGALGACVAGHRSAEPGHAATLAYLGLRPLVDLELRLGEGTGALLALPLVQSAVRVLHDVATFDAAGVTEKDAGRPASQSASQPASGSAPESASGPEAEYL